MSADFETEHFKGYLHTVPGSRSGQEPYIHVTQAGDGGYYPAGSFTLAEITELAAMAGQAWPEGAGVRIRYEIEFRREHSEEWTLAWGMNAGMAGGDEPDEDYAQAVYEGFNAEGTWRLVRRTVLTSDEVLSKSGE